MTNRHHRAAAAGAALAICIAGRAVLANQPTWEPWPAAWKGDLTPITAADWSYDRAEHLLGRAGFGGAPEDVWRLVDMTPEQAVRAWWTTTALRTTEVVPILRTG